MSRYGFSNEQNMFLAQRVGRCQDELGVVVSKDCWRNRGRSRRPGRVWIDGLRGEALRNQRQHGPKPGGKPQGLCWGMIHTLLGSSWACESR